jgi:hypothetical protein
VTGLSDGAYNVRAVLKDRNDNYSESESITVYIDKVEFEVEEKMVDGILQKRQKVKPNQENTIVIADVEKNSFIEINIPKYALSSETVIKIENDLLTPPEIKHLEKIQLCNITLESKEKMLSNGKEALITISYPDVDNDGIVDGINITEDDLAIFSYNSIYNFWERNKTTEIDKVKNTCSAKIKHFSIYGLFQASTKNLDDILVYPNPYVPHDGIDANGKPCIPGDINSGIIFENLTKSLEIHIYTLSGELVWNRYINSTSGRIQWDAKDNKGEDVPSGIYFAVFTSTTGQKKVLKIAIIR